MERKGEMTKALLGQKFKELVVKKSFDKITIKMITDEAGVIRPTFYNYFRDKYEVMEWLLWEDVFSSATELVKMNMARSALEMTRKKYPDVPYFMLGHSMGSFLLRQYLTMYAEGLAGVVIMGTGHQGMLTLCAGRMICRIIAAFKGWKYRSTFVDNLSFGGFNKKFEPGETSKEWITSDKKKRDEYVRDPLCSYTFTLGAYYQMFAGMKVLVRKGSMKRIPKTLPVLFTAGSDDPVGAFGKNVIRVYEKYKDAGIKDVSIHLYKGDRHEILNEVDRQNVYQDILAWIEEKNRR